MIEVCRFQNYYGLQGLQSLWTKSSHFAMNRSMLLIYLIENFSQEEGRESEGGDADKNERM